MSATTTSQNTGNVVIARTNRDLVCSTGWTTFSADTSVNFAEMVLPAHKHLGYGAGNTIPIQRSLKPM